MAFKLPQIKRIGFYKFQKPKTMAELQEEKDLLEAKQRYREEVKEKSAEREKLEKEISELKGEKKFAIPLPKISEKSKKEFAKGFQKEYKKFWGK
jgi:hypothetical protein